MAFTAKDVATLREMSGAGMMDCKKALTACDGDMDKAMDYLREKSLAASAKKASRIAAEGVVAGYVKDCACCGAIVEINCETDFVAKTDAFVELADMMAKQVTVNNTESVEALMAETVLDGQGTVSELVNAKVAKIGEKITIRRFARCEAKDGCVDTYIHLGGKIGVIVEAGLEGIEATAEVRETLHNVAMQVAAANPTCVRREEVASEDIEKEREILIAQAKNEPKPKPDAIIEKMVNGRIDKYYKEVCLLEQPYVKENSMSVGEFVDSVANKLGGKIVIRKFVRFEMGEGLQKREDNFVDEVMSQVN